MSAKGSDWNWLQPDLLQKQELAINYFSPSLDTILYGYLSDI